MDVHTLDQKREQYVHGNHHEQMIIERYEATQKLQTAIELGNVEAAFSLIMQEFDNARILNQLYSPTDENCRTLHNRLVSFHAICMVCALRANPNPLYLHVVSCHYDTMIEKTLTAQQTSELLHSMITDYCSFSNYFDKKKYSDTIQQTIWNITAYPDRPLNLSQLSKSLGMSLPSLSRKFRQETGRTISQYHMEFRIRSAQRYLQEGHLSITQVAYHVGFNDASYFSKVFTKQTGYTPTEYVRQFHKN